MADPLQQTAGPTHLAKRIFLGAYEAHGRKNAEAHAAHPESSRVSPGRILDKTRASLGA